MKRSNMKRKRRKGDKPKVRLEYLQEHSTCAVCWAGWREFDNWLECHHICGGSGRKDRVENLVTLCKACHHRYHTGHGLTPGMILWAKRESDPEHYDESVILKLLGRKSLPERWELVPIPDWAIEAREQAMNLEEKLRQVAGDGWKVRVFKKEDKLDYTGQITKPKAMFPDMVFNHAVNVDASDPVHALEAALDEVLSKEWTTVEVYGEDDED